MVLVGISNTGCDQTQAQRNRPSTDGPTATTQSDPAAAALLEEVVRCYRQLTHYQDNGQVVLRYRFEGRWEQDRAPMQVAVDRPQRRLAFSVYSLRAGPHGDRFYLRCEDQDPRIHGQLISRKLPDRLTLDWLLSDPIVAEKLGAGLAGFPLQLNLLLDDQPLQRLIDGAVIRLVGSQTLDGTRMTVIVVQRPEGEYRMWIDPRTFLVHRVRFPMAHLDAQMRQDQRVSEIELALEIPQIVTERAVDWKPLALQPRSGEMRVVRFVPRPAAAQDPWTGRSPPAFRLDSPLGRPAFRSDQVTGKDGLVLLWLADHPASRAAAMWLSQLAAELRAEGLADRFELVSVWAEPGPPPSMTFPHLVEAWKMPGTVAIDREAVGRDLFGILAAPSLVVLDRRGKVQARVVQWGQIETFPLVDFLRQLAGGQDMAAEAERKRAVLEQRFAAEVRLMASADATMGSDDVPPHRPAWIQAEPIENHPITPPATVASWDAHGDFYWLAGDGQLYRRRHRSGEVEMRPTAPWISSAPTRLTIAPSQRFALLIRDLEKRAAVVDLQGGEGENAVAPLPGPVVGACWLSAASASAESDRLLVVTAEGDIGVWTPTTGHHRRYQSMSTVRALIEPSSATALPRLLLHSGDVVMPEVGGGDTPAAVATLAAADRHQLVSTGQPSEHPSSSHGRRLLPVGKVGVELAAWLAMPWRAGSHDWLVLPGMLAPEEMALYLLDHQYQPQWHYRVPAAAFERGPIFTSGSVEDPASGLPCWAIVDRWGVIYIVRRDGLVDHFKPAEKGAVRAVRLVSANKSLRLELAYADGLDAYRIELGSVR